MCTYLYFLYTNNGTPVANQSAGNTDNGKRSAVAVPIEFRFGLCAGVPHSMALVGWLGAGFNGHATPPFPCLSIDLFWSCKNKTSLVGAVNV